MACRACGLGRAFVAPMGPLPRAAPAKPGRLDWKNNQNHVFFLKKTPVSFTGRNTRPAWKSARRRRIPGVTAPAGS